MNFLRANGGRTRSTSFGPNVDIKLLGRFSSSLALNWSHNIRDNQWYGRNTDSLGVDQYTFAHLDQTTTSATMRLNYTFTPNLSLETYAEPFAASGQFHSFGELLVPRSRQLLLYGTGGTSIQRNADGSHTVTDGAATFDIEPQDFNVGSFRSNVVLRWEWRPGSTAFLVWQQDRSGDRVFRTARPGDLFDAFKTRGDNILALKVSYWLALD